MRRVVLLRAALAAGVALAGAAPGIAQSPGADPAGLTRRMGLKPGHWSTRITITSLEITPVDPAKPLPPEAAAKIAEAKGKTQDTDDCLGDKPPVDGALILPGLSIAADCRYDSIDTTGGRLRIAAICGTGADGSSSETIEESFTPDHMTGTASVKAVGGGMNVAVAMTLDSHYVGAACPLKAP